MMTVAHFHVAGMELVARLVLTRSAMLAMKVSGRCLSIWLCILEAPGDELLGSLAMCFFTSAIETGTRACESTLSSVCFSSVSARFLCASSNSAWAPRNVFASSSAKNSASCLLPLVLHYKRAALSCAGAVSRLVDLTPERSRGRCTWSEALQEVVPL